MDYKEALKRIKALEVDDAAELGSAIESEHEKLSSRAYDLIGEKRTVTQKSQAMQVALEAIAKAVGVEGDTDTILEATQSKVSGLASENAQLKTEKTALETRATEAEGKVQGFERKDKLGDIAKVAGANSAVLEKLFSDRLDDLKVEGEGDSRTVKLGDKSLKEHVEGDDSLKAFAPALFPGEKTGEKTQPKLPSGGPSGGDQSPDVLQNYLSRRRTGAKQLTEK